MTLKEQVIKNLVDFHGIMEKLKINFFLMDGTLLGLYRDGGLIEGDYDDIDVGIFEEDEPRMRDIIPAMEEAGFFNNKSFRLKGMIEGLSFKRWVNHIDIFLVHRKGNEAFNLARNCCKIGSLDYMAYIYPAECFEKLGEIFFEGMMFKIPCKTDRFLAARYNENWRTPHMRTEGFDMCNVKQNKALRGNYEYE